MPRVKLSRSGDALSITPSSGPALLSPLSAPGPTAALAPVHNPAVTPPSLLTD